MYAQALPFYGATVANILENGDLRLNYDDGDAGNLDPGYCVFLTPPEDVEDDVEVVNLLPPGVNVVSEEELLTVLEEAGNPPLFEPGVFIAQPV